MSIKRFLIILVSAAALLSLGVFSLVSHNYITDYFGEYIDEEYLKNVENLKEYAKTALADGIKQKSVLNSYISDPIYYAEVLDPDGDTVSYSGMMMHNSFSYDADTMTIDSYEIYDGNELLGYLNIIRETDIADTATHKLFHKALLLGAVLSVAVTLPLLGIIMFLLIKYISRNVDNVVEYATHEGTQHKNFQINELNQIADAIRSYKIKLTEKEKVKKQKFDKLLHDTKTPITIIKSQLEGIEDGVVKPDSDRISSMLSAADDLCEILKDVTDIVEGVSKNETVILSETDYSAELEKMVKSLSDKFQRKGLQLVQSGGEFIINTNTELLNKAVYNLLMNSFKYTKKGRVTILADSNSKTLSIKDTGIGISDDDIANVFEPYFRGKNTGGTEGEGLGLSIAKENIQKAGGSISIRSKEGSFTEYIISF